MTFRTLRIAFFLTVLVSVALGGWLSRVRSTDWDRPLWVAVYPLSADGSETADQHIASLTAQSFAAIEEFMSRESQAHGAALTTPVRMKLYDRVDSLPPALDPQAGPLSRALWSLRVRFWAWQAETGNDGPPPDISLFVLYHDPVLSPTVPHSLGLQKGLIGIVHAFADRQMHGANNIVIAHELLHTLGATDKYDAASDRPVFPAGYGDPERKPLFPQELAEIMAGRRMLSDTEWEMPESLRDVTIGSVTAAEINWTHAD